MKIMSWHPFVFYRVLIPLAIEFGFIAIIRGVLRITTFNLNILNTTSSRIEPTVNTHCTRSTFFSTFKRKEITTYQHFHFFTGKPTTLSQGKTF